MQANQRHKDELRTTPNDWCEVEKRPQLKKIMQWWQIERVHLKNNRLRNLTIKSSDQSKIQKQKQIKKRISTSTVEFVGRLALCIRWPGMIKIRNIKEFIMCFMTNIQRPATNSAWVCKQQKLFRFWICIKKSEERFFPSK